MLSPAIGFIFLARKWIVWLVTSLSGFQTICYDRCTPLKLWQRSISYCNQKHRVGICTMCKGVNSVLKSSGAFYISCTFTCAQSKIALKKWVMMANLVYFKLIRHSILKFKYISNPCNILNLIPTSYCHVILMYGLIPPCASRNRFKQAVSLLE